MNQTFYVELLKTLGVTWAKAQGIRRLRKFADTPEADIHVSWKLVRFSADVWVMRVGAGAPARKAKALAGVKIDDEEFQLWWVKGTA